MNGRTRFGRSGGDDDHDGTLCYSPTPQPVMRFDKHYIWAIGDLTSAAAPWFMGLVEEP